MIDSNSFVPSMIPLILYFETLVFDSCFLNFEVDQTIINLADKLGFRALYLTVSLTRDNRNSKGDFYRAEVGGD